MAVFLRSTTASSVRNPWTQSRPWVAVSAPSAARPALRASTPPLPRQLPPPCRDSVSRPQQPADQGPGPRQGDGTQQPAAKGGAASSDDAAGTRTDSTLRRRQQAVETILASLQSYSSNASAGADQSGMLDLLQQLLPPLLEVRDRLAAHCPAAALTQQQLLAVAQQQLAALQRIEGQLAVAGARAEEDRKERRRQHRELVLAVDPYQDLQQLQEQYDYQQQRMHNKEGSNSDSDQPPPQGHELSGTATAATPQEHQRATLPATTAHQGQSPPLGTVAADRVASRGSDGSGPNMDPPFRSKAGEELLMGAGVSGGVLAAVAQQVQQEEGARGHGGTGYSGVTWRQDPLAGYYDEYDED